MFGDGRDLGTRMKMIGRIAEIIWSENEIKGQL
jgi:hypothetical protein